jgi:glycosyltransferase involved in cell wall biosynthesis
MLNLLRNRIIPSISLNKIYPYISENKSTSMKNEVSKKSLSLIIPAHNAEHIIEDSVIEYNNIFSDIEEFEIIIVCNACTDNTFKVVTNLAKRYPIKILNIPHRGKGNALRRGFDKAQFQLMGFLDSDNPFSLQKIREMVNSLDKYDLTIATKYLKGSLKSKKGVQDSQLRRIIALGGQTFVRIFFNLKFRDTQAGAKFFRRYVWESIGKNIICVGFDFDIELLYKSTKKGFNIAEFYTPLIKYEKFSTVRIKFIAGMVYRLIKLRFQK